VLLLGDTTFLPLQLIIAQHPLGAGTQPLLLVVRGGPPFFQPNNKYPPISSPFYAATINFSGVTPSKTTPHSSQLLPETGKHLTDRTGRPKGGKHPHFFGTKLFFPPQRGPGAAQPRPGKGAHNPERPGCSLATGLCVPGFGAQHHKQPRGVRDFHWHLGYSSAHFAPHTTTRRVPKNNPTGGEPTSCCAPSPLFKGGRSSWRPTFLQTPAALPINHAAPTASHPRSAAPSAQQYHIFHTTPGVSPLPAQPFTPRGEPNHTSRRNETPTLLHSAPPTTQTIVLSTPARHPTRFSVSRHHPNLLHGRSRPNYLRQHLP